MSETRSRRAARALQIGFLMLLTICVAQLAYWMVDEYRFTSTIRAQKQSAYVSSARWAADLTRAGIAWSQIVSMHPEIERAPDGAIRVSLHALAQLDDDRFHRMNRYAWEGAFFLSVLLGAMAVVYTAIRAETTLRRQQSLFLAAASHELRSPLASLRLSADTLALRDPPPKHRAELVQRVLADLGRLDGTISNILDASRLAGNGVHLAREPVVLTQAVGAVVEELQMMASEAGVRIDVDVPATLTLVADREGVHTVLRNLVHNAIKASRDTTPGGAVSVVGTLEDRFVRLEVHDHGMGFNTTESGHLFEKFYRIESTGQERLPGTGLGLYLVRRCMELEGGSAHASSDGRGRGACFTVRWPKPQREA